MVYQVNQRLTKCWILNLLRDAHWWKRKKYSRKRAHFITFTSFNHVHIDSWDCGTSVSCLLNKIHYLSSLFFKLNNIYIFLVLSSRLWSLVFVWFVPTLLAYFPTVPDSHMWRYFCKCVVWKCFPPLWTISHSVHMLFVDTWVYFNSTNLDVFVLCPSTTTDTDSILPCCLVFFHKCWTQSLLVHR